MRVVKSSSIFFGESNDGVVYLCHLRYGPCKLDILDHPKIGFVGLFGQPNGRCAPYDHSYISDGRSRMFILSLWGLLLWWIHLFLTNEPLQFPLSYKSFYLLLQIVAVACVVVVITVEPAILIP